MTLVSPKSVIITLQAIEEILDEPCSMDSPMSLLGNDSLETLWAIGQIETTFKTKIPDEQLVQFKTIGEMATWLASNT